MTVAPMKAGRVRVSTQSGATKLSRMKITDQFRTAPSSTAEPMA